MNYYQPMGYQNNMYGYYTPNNYQPNVTNNVQNSLQGNVVVWTEVLAIILKRIKPRFIANSLIRKREQV